MPILHSLISGNQFADPRLTTKIPEIWWQYSDAEDSILTYSKRVLDGSGDIWMRIEQGIIPNLLGAAAVLRGWRVRDRHGVRADRRHELHADGYLPAAERRTFPELAGGAFGIGPEKKIWGQMTLEEHQRNPLDYEAQSSQGKITFHSEEHLVASDRGVNMHRRLYRRECQIVADGGDPVGVAFAEEDRVIKIEARSWMVSANEAATAPRNPNSGAHEPPEDE